MSNSLRELLDKDEMWYLVLTSKKESKDYGYIKTNKELDKYIASFAREAETKEVLVSFGRNIMDDDGPTQVFNVDIKINSQ